MIQMLALGPLELVIGLGLLAIIPLTIYGIYRMGYRVGSAEGALKERDKPAKKKPTKEEDEE